MDVEGGKKSWHVGSRLTVGEDDQGCVGLCVLYEDDEESGGSFELIHKELDMETYGRRWFLVGRRAKQQ